MITLLSKGLSRVFSSTTVQRHQFFGTQPFFKFIVQLSHPHMTTGETIGLTIQTSVGKLLCLCFLIHCLGLSCFFPKSKRLLISWLQSLSTVILEFKKIKSVTESESHSVMSDSLQPHGLCSPWNSPGQSTEVGSLSVLQRIFPTQGSNSGLLH